MPQNKLRRFTCLIVQHGLLQFALDDLKALINVPQERFAQTKYLFKTGNR